MTDGFTWTSLFAQKLIDKGAGSEPTEMPVDEALQGKHVGLYFSAHWWVGLAQLLSRTFQPPMKGINPP